MRRPWQREQSAMPEGVRFVMADGREIPVDCVYRGEDTAGIHVWEPAWQPGGQVTNIQVRKLPARTALALPEEWTP